MPDRRLLGDAALAVLIALPTAAISRPEPLIHEDRGAAVAPAQTQAVAERPPPTPRGSLLG